MPSLARLFLSGLMLIASGAGHALSIGEIELESSLGEPLYANIPVRLDESALPQRDCFRLVGPGRHHPDLAGARLSLVSKGDRTYLYLTSPAPVNDPVLDISIRTEGCGPTMQRDYVLLLSPRDVERYAEAVPPVLVAAPAAPVVGAIPPPSTSAGGGDGARAKPPRAAAESTPARPNGGYVLRLDYGYGEFGQMAERIAQRKQAAYQSARAKRRPAAPSGGGLTAEISRIPVPRADRPAAVAEPRAAAPATQPAQPAPAAVPGAPASGKDVLVLHPPPLDEPSGAPSGAVGPEAPPARPDAAATPASGGAGRPVAADGGAQVIAAPPPPGGAAESYWRVFASYNVLVPIILLLLVLAVALWLKYRAPASRFMGRTQPDFSSLAPADPDDPQLHPLLSRNLPSINQVYDGAVKEPEAPPPAEARTPASPPAEAETGPATIAGLGLMPAFNPAAEISVDIADTPDHVLEMAEVMLAFGRSSQAMETLSQYIRENPRQAVEPWLKLLELYRQSGLRDEFETLAGNLHRHFNVAMPEWESYGEETDADGTGTPLSLESLPHIMARLTAMWDKPECLDYLEKLLEDNRGGQRIGFSLPIVRDILLLRDILHLGNPAPARNTYR